MDAVTISPKFQVVIPKAVRDRLRLVPGQTVQVFAHGDRMEFIPVRPAQQLRGMLRDVDEEFVRDETDRL
jgi:AbrB family looped-hinge helix DNA binding protein